MKLQDGEALTLDIAGAEVSLSAAIVTEMFLDRVRAQSAVVELLPATAEFAPPSYKKIGETMHDGGGVFAGIARGQEGAPDYYLVVMDEIVDVRWGDAMSWAATVQGRELPSRAELALCFASVPELFQKTLYWSRESVAGDEAYAWFQSFSDGLQDGSHKGYELRARAVRRLPI